MLSEIPTIPLLSFVAACHFPPLVAMGRSPALQTHVAGAISPRVV
jgi:hypothetical protein